jgi:hypothetical protein
MKQATELEQEIAVVAAGAAQFVEPYLDYAQNYKAKTDEWIDAYLREELPDVPQHRAKLAAVIPTSVSPAQVKQAVAKIKSELNPIAINHEKTSGKIYVWVDEPSPAGRA